MRTMSFALAGALLLSGGVVLADEKASFEPEPVYSMPSTSPSPALEEMAQVWDKIDFFGDLRLRYQGDFNRNTVDVDMGGGATEGRDNDEHTGRMRFRFGLRYPVVESLKFETRLRARQRNSDNSDALYNDDPRSEDVVLGDGFRNMDLSLDLLNLKYQILGERWSWLWGGKFENFFVRNPVYGDLTWDPDVNPEGLAAGIDLASDDGLVEALKVGAGYYIAVDQDRKSDVTTFSAQASARLGLGDHVDVMVASGYYGFTNPTPDGNDTLLNLNEGNLVVDGQFVSDFNVWDSYLALVVDVADVPIVVSGSWIYNTGARTNRDTGWTAGMALGRLEQAGTVRAYYQYQKIEQDALFTPVARSDFLKLSNYKGNALGIDWRFEKNLIVGTNVSWVQTLEEENTGYTQPRDETRLRIEFTVLF